MHTLLDLPLPPHVPVDIRAKKLLYPPGSRLVTYEAIPPSVAERIPQRRPQRLVTTVRFAVSAPALPPLADTVHLTDRLRAAAMKKLGQQRDPDTPHGALAGKSADGQPLTDHSHAHYLALPGSDRRIEELAVWAPGGLTDDELLRTISVG